MKRPNLAQDSELFFTLSLDMVCIAGTDGYFRRLNPAFEKTLGYTEAELLSRPFIDFVHPEDVPATRAEVAKLAQGLPTIAFQNRYRCKDGTYRWLSWRCQPAPDGTLYAIARDITEHELVLQELHERELEARAANRAKSMFLAAMSHEIRTPLIGVIGMLELLGRSRLHGEQRRQFNIARQSAHSLLEIIGNILDYSKIEAGKIDLEQETVSMRDLMARVVSTFSASAESKGLQLTQAVDPRVAPAHRADGVRLMQILSNFVGNAVKFTERGSVAVAVQATNDEPGEAQPLAFTVADTGIGMTREQLDRVFRPFAQADAGTTRRFGGTGLGLVISQRLAELMGGAVRADSEPGRGTVMTLELRLPLGDQRDIAATAAIDEPPVVARPKPTREQAEREGSLLLLAEDHPVNRVVLTTQLDLAGFLVDTAEDGTRALERFATGAYALVLTDLHMPGLDGFQLTAAIREFERANGWQRTPILALTADVVREHVERCLAGGMDDYVSKPVTIRHLVEKLRQWLPHLDREQPAAASAREAPPRPSPAVRAELPAPVDDFLIRQYTGGDAAKAREFLGRYCQAAADDVRALDRAQNGDGAVARVAHRIRGAALMIGAREVAGIAARIERLADGSRNADVAALADELRRAVARVESYARRPAP